MLHHFLDQPSQYLLLLCSWGLMTLLIYSSVRTLIQGIAHLKRLHSIPCHRCVYFTGHYQLKCTVHPSQALTEQAINCPDALTCPKTQDTVPVMPWKTDSAHPLLEACYADSTSDQQQRHLSQPDSRQPTLL